MPLADQFIKPILLPFKGVNMIASPHDVREGEAIQTQNCFYRRGLNLKFGTQKHSSNEIVASKKVVGLHRFYYNTNSRKLIAACGPNISHLDDGAGTWTSLTTGQTDSLRTHFTTWGAVNTMYGANGTDTPFSINSSLTFATMASAPANTVMFLPYRDRLLSIDRDDPSYIRWSGSYVTTSWTTTAQAIRIPGAGANEVIKIHSSIETATGVSASVFVGNTNGIYLLWGLDLDPARASFNVRLDPVGGPDNVGCVSPHTVVSTPKGTFWLGNDKQVYLLPYDSSFMLPVGDKITSGASSFKGLESIPVAQIPEAAAIYHDGFYKLSFAISGGTTNTRQYWLDVKNLQRDENGLWGPWFGPMIGMEINVFAHQNGSGDDGRLLGGDDNAKGFVYSLNEDGIFGDDTAAFTMIYFSNHEQGVPGFDTRVMGSQIELTDPASSFTLAFYDTTGILGSSQSISPLGTGITWGDQNWGTFNWQSTTTPTRRVVQHGESSFLGQRIATRLEYSTSTDHVIFYDIKHQVHLVPELFQVRV